jgi:hypothetical protein
MTTEEVVLFYGSKAAIARALGIKKASVSGWGDEPPHGRQCEIQILTKGKLKASPKKHNGH